NSTLTYKTQPPPHTTLFPYTTLFRSLIHKQLRHPVVGKTGRPCIGSEVLAVISAESGMRAKPQMAVVVLRNGDHRITSQSVFNGDRKSTRLNSSHVKISYAVFCLKKK